MHKISAASGPWTTSDYYVNVGLWLFCLSYPFKDCTSLVHVQNHKTPYTVLCSSSSSLPMCWYPKLGEWFPLPVVLRAAKLCSYTLIEHFRRLCIIWFKTLQSSCVTPPLNPRRLPTLANMTCLPDFLDTGKKLHQLFEPADIFFYKFQKENYTAAIAVLN